VEGQTNRIDAAFERLKADGRLGLFPYLMTGFPTLDATMGLAEAAVEAGADGLELGVPFSDPLADGTTIQRAGEVALRNGATLAYSIELVARLRAHLSIPLILMTYFNPIHRYGLDRFVADSVSAGVDGVIVPDLPSSEATDLVAVASPRQLYVIPLIAPTTTDEHLAEVGRTARGFVYCVSLLGTTGARSQLSDRLPEFIARVRKHVAQPVMIGFGIARPEHVAAVRSHADAVAIGSAIADLLAEAGPQERESALATYLRAMREAGNGGRVATEMRL
jgi:tryptophan synthase alpha chain